LKGVATKYSTAYTKDGKTKSFANKSKIDSDSETTDWETLPEKQGISTASLPDESMIYKVSFQLLLLFLCVCYLLLYLHYPPSIVILPYLMF